MTGTIVTHLVLCTRLRVALVRRLCHRYGGFVEGRRASLDDQRLSRRLGDAPKDRAMELLERAPPNPMTLFGTLRLLTSRFDVVWPRDQA